MRRLFFMLALAACVSASAAEFGTYRGDAARSGNPEGKAGPAKPRILWAVKSKEHFMASPVTAGDRVFVSGLSFVNTSILYALDAEPKSAKRIAWQKTSPLLELATVSSPAVLGEAVVFGDGMHQTNGASLYGMNRATGSLLWQLKVDGDLVHLEGSPTVAGGKVYIGGGAAGVLCVDPSKLTLDGKAVTAAEAAKAIAAKRDALQKAFEEAKSKGDMFAVPPTDRDLPRAVPAVLWQAGKTKWHVDAPVAVAGENVLVASAFLDKEKLGERSVFCLDAKTGKEKWAAKLAVNPWGGPSVSGSTVVVTGSSIAYEPAAIRGSKGAVTALDLETGKVKWRKELPAAALGCAALTADAAVVTCADGKVRCYALATGAIKWTYNAGEPIFAPAALSPETVYVGDLKGVVHAVNLKSGVGAWKIDIGTDPETASPGMFYAGPVVHKGRLYVATCNLAGPNANKATVVACIGE